MRLPYAARWGSADDGFPELLVCQHLLSQIRRNVPDTLSTSVCSVFIIDTRGQRSFFM